MTQQLAAAFPGHQWSTVRTCSLHVADGGAGLDLEACEHGYLVEGVGESPGQDAALRPHCIIVNIGGASLFGLDEDAMEAAFAREFRDGVELVLVDQEEVRRAVIERDSQGECPCQEDIGEADAPGDVSTEHGSVLRVPLASAEVVRSLSPQLRDDLARDLETFAGRHGVRVELHCPDGPAVATLTLCGCPDEVAAARPELDALVNYYAIGATTAVLAPEEPAETLEVDGMVVQSLPARGRRRRKGQDIEDGEGAAAPIHDTVEGDQEPGEGRGDAKEAVRSSGGPDTPETRQFEYMDHTADVILHSWGKSLPEAFEQVCVAFFSYMSELDTVDMEQTVEVEATGHDLVDLLYHLLDEFLFNFGTELILCRRVEVLEFDQANLKVRARGHGERFNLKKHPQGTEIKAITMHQMKILTPDTVYSQEGTHERKADELEGGTARECFPYECYVLVDI